MSQWYKLVVQRAHMGAGRQDTTTAYIFANNITEVLNRYKIMPGVKRYREEKYRFPDIFPLSDKDSQELEKIIVQEGRLPLDKAKKSWYYKELI